MIRKQRITTEKSRGIGMHIEEICYSFLLMAFAFDSKKNGKRDGACKKRRGKGEIHQEKCPQAFVFIYIVYISSHTVPFKN